MFEQNVLSKLQMISKNKDIKKEFFILTHKKHGREIYFEKDNKNAIKFMKIKFDSFFKKIVYLLIRINVLQLFLKKIKLPSDIGPMIFVGGQIKIFNFKEKEVLSIPKTDQESDEFIRSKKFQKKINPLNISPKIIEINLNIPFSREEFLFNLKKFNYEEAFSVLLGFYKKNKIKKVKLKKYTSILKKELLKKNISNMFIFDILNKMKSHNFEVLEVLCHGDFAKWQILKDKTGLKITDWQQKRGLIILDLLRFFMQEKRILQNKDFLKIIKKYPKEVRLNIKYYLILNEIELSLESPKYLKKALRKIDKLLNTKPQKLLLGNSQ